MKKFLKKYGIYIGIFIFTFCFYEFFNFKNAYGDPMNNYCFSYAIARGEVPYLDFNTISTPLYAFLMSIGLLFFNNYVMFILEQSLLVTIMCYFLYSLYGKKSYLLLVGVSLFGFLGVEPTYNFMAFFILIFLLFLEKKQKDKDYLIGFVMGLGFLSKHTVGILLFLLPTLKYYKNREKIKKRMLGFFIPIIIFFFYLLLTGSLYSFIDLCFLGLFDFTEKNGNFFDFYTFISLLCLILSIITTIKNKEDISNYYLLAGFSFVVPLFNFHHFSIYFLCFLLQLLPLIKNWNLSYSILSIVTAFLFSAITVINIYIYLKPTFCSEFNHFQYSLKGKLDYEESLENYKLFDRYPNSLILSSEKRLYDISRNRKIDYYDAFFYGNFGYHGSEKMIESIKKMHHRYVILDKHDYNADFDNQFDLKIANYIINNTKYIKTERYFDIYYLE